MTGMSRSRTIARGCRSPGRSSSASRPFEATATENPSSRRASSRVSRISRSSSTTSTVLSSTTFPGLEAGEGARGGPGIAGEPDREAGPLLRGGGHADDAGVGQDDLLADEQTQTDAARSLALSLGARSERLEDDREHLGRDGPAVGDLEDDLGGAISVDLQ